MLSEGMTHTEVPSLRRVYRSRAVRSALVASGACSEPARTWDSPRDARTKTYHRGQEALRFSVMSLGSNQVCISGFLLTTSLFFGVGGRGFANPSTIFVCLAAVLHTLDVAWTIAFDDGHELIPVQFTEVIVSAFF